MNFRDPVKSTCTLQPPLQQMLCYLVIMAIASCSSANKMCSSINSSLGMTDSGRQRVVELHNTLRSHLSNGKVINGPYNGHFKKGGNIMKMEYDCELEAIADEIAVGCKIDEVNERRLSQTGENLYVFTGSEGGIHEVIKRAIHAWWNEIFTSGVNRKVLFTKYIAQSSSTPLEFIQMAWATTRKIGCARMICSGRQFFVCKYEPEGRILNKPIFRYGDPCSLCEKCDKNLGLCLA
ncbi:hypothetical protein Y032_0149g2708 [Ancylostoma ceylanicum]|uniref:SCP domain-containing protein n=1 Tax=Ancylostoma ceylanicum TaxID=53326 RepID=A0A016T1J0_9BILA|nr:hypothetical protein Y032_0149g2708 [Ancylostoma ceylanicum]